jgi:hypothetical protein
MKCKTRPKRALKVRWLNFSYDFAELGNELARLQAARLQEMRRLHRLNRMKRKGRKHEEE